MTATTTREREREREREVDCFNTQGRFGRNRQEELKAHPTAMWEPLKNVAMLQTHKHEQKQGGRESFYIYNLVCPNPERERERERFLADSLCGLTICHC